jgi:hypothetical protein
VCEVSNLLVSKKESYRPSTAIIMVERRFYNVKKGGSQKFMEVRRFIQIDFESILLRSDSSS